MSCATCPGGLQHLVVENLGVFRQTGAFRFQVVVLEERLGMFGVVVAHTLPVETGDALKWWTFVGRLEWFVAVVVSNIVLKYHFK